MSWSMGVIEMHLGKCYLRMFLFNSLTLTYFQVVVLALLHAPMHYRPMVYVFFSGWFMLNRTCFLICQQEWWRFCLENSRSILSTSILKSCLSSWTWHLYAYF